MLDAREHPEPGKALEQLQPPNGLSVIVVFAPADQTNQVAQAIKRSPTFAVLPVPIEIAKTAAVLEGAREEAMARRSVVAEPQAAASQEAPRSQPSGPTCPPSPHRRPGPLRARPARRPSPNPSTWTLCRSTPAPRHAAVLRARFVLGGIAAFALLAAAGAWLFLRGGDDPASLPTASSVEEPVVDFDRRLRGVHDDRREHAGACGDYTGCGAPAAGRGAGRDRRAAREGADRLPGAPLHGSGERQRAPLLPLGAGAGVRQRRSARRPDAHRRCPRQPAADGDERAALRRGRRRPSRTSS